MKNTHEMNKSEYAKGGAIYKGDKVRIKDSNKSMVVKNIAKGKKGYVEFSGDAGTYLKGDLEKMAKGGAVSKSEKEKLSNIAYQLQNASDSWISKNHGKFVEMQNEYKKQFKKVYGHTNYADPNDMAKGGNMYAKGGLTEHGLRTGDSLGKSADNSVIVYPYNKDERSPKVVNLNVGKRIDAKEYSSMDEKGRDKFTKMAKGGGVAFKPYGKTKGLYSITYSENGEAQSETWESLEMAMDRVKRLKKMSNVSNVKLVKPKMAKGGAIDTAKSMWSKKNKRFRANMLEKVGYSSGVANDLSFEEWDSLEKGVHIRLATLFSNKKTSTMAKGGKTKSKQDPPVIRGYVDDEPYEYGDGGTMNCWCYEIGGL